MEKIKLLVAGLLVLVFTSVSVFGYSGGSGTSADPYLISNKADLLALGANTNDYDKCFKMTADIDLSITNFTSAVIAPDTSSSSSFQGTKFTGVFDGNSNNVLNLSMSGGSNLGLFGHIGSGGEVKNLGIVDCNVSGNDVVGGLCGENYYGIISSCYSTGSVSGDYDVGGLCGSTEGGTFLSCYSTGAASGDDCAGGLCGYTYYGTILFCYSTGEVSGEHYVGGLCGENDYVTISSCYSTGEVSGDQYVGGLCGKNDDGTISSCYSTGSVSGGQDYVGGLCGYNTFYGTISSCYSTGTVSDGNRVGGFCGYNDYDGTISSCYSRGVVYGANGSGGFCADNDGSISSCFWDIETSTWSISDGGVGKTTAQMQTESTFTAAGWDFVDTWLMDGYPALKAFYTEQEIYELWGENFNVPTNECGYTNCPAGDRIQNLLKYAIGLNPMEVCSVQDLMEPVADETNGVSIVYRKAKGVEGVELFPIWSDSLLPSNWNAEGFEFAVISQTDSNVTWKATHSVTGECGYIKLKAQTGD